MGRLLGGKVIAVGVFLMSALALVGCKGDDGVKGDPGPPGGTTVTDNGDGTYTISDVNGASVTVREAGEEGCTVVDNGDGTFTITCSGESVTVRNGQDGVDGENCTVADNDDGTYTLTCGGDVVTVSDGEHGQDGENCTVADNANGTYTLTCGDDVVTVSDGEDGAPGENCGLVDNGNGTVTITCGDDSATVSDGAPGESCTVADNGDGTYTITCGGDQVTVRDGRDGQNCWDLNGNGVGDPASEDANGDGFVDVRDCKGDPGTVQHVIQESCLVCHGDGRVADIATVHPALVPISDVQASIDSVSVAVDDGAQTATLTVSFTVKDERGDPIRHLGDANPTNPARLAYLRFALAKLEPAAQGSGDPDLWVNYTRGDRSAANLTDHEDGTYTYVFATDLYSLYDASRRHRVLLIVFDDIVEQAKNVTYDFVPEQLPGPEFVFDLSRDIVATSACNECHGRLGSPLSAATFHGGTRYLTEGCVVCHTTLGDEAEFRFAPFIHKIHSAKRVNDEVDFTNVTFPQDLKNCAKCHAGTDGEHWNTRPSIEACGSCHDDVDFATGTNHDGGAQANNANCKTCHPPNGGLSPIIEAHLTEISTPHNPDVPEGLVNFAYVIEEVTVSQARQPVVKFRILLDGEPVTFNTFTQGGTTLIDNFTGSPGFIVGYALPQDGIETPADYNQLGQAAGQPASVSILNVWNGTQGTLSGPDESGNYIATLNGSNNSALFPEGAMMRAVAIQSYFTQVSPASARHAVSVVQPVTGDTVRRKVVEVAKCTNCHEALQLHGGSRVNEVQVCVICHNPNLSSSGRGSDPVGLLNNPNASASAKAAAQATIDAVGTDPLVYPESTMQFRNLIHGIHSAAKRTFPFEFVRDRGNSGVFYYDFSEVTFPGILSNCETCHVPGTAEGRVYDAYLPEGVLISTDFTTDGLGTTKEGIQAARQSVPNATDLINSPIAGTCYMCHNSNPAAFHFGQMGGVIDGERSEALGE